MVKSSKLWHTAKHRPSRKALDEWLGRVAGRANCNGGCISTWFAVNVRPWYMQFFNVGWKRIGPH
jgi:hypothetical protein